MNYVNSPDGQFSDDFIRKMKARMYVGFFRYGHVSELQNKRKDVDIIETLKKRIAKYEETGNSEWLVDAANYCMIEFMYPQHENAHFESIEEEDENKRVGVVKRDVEILLRVDEENGKGLI